MIGVTIGVGYPYSRLASIAAACVEKHTGLKCHILDHTHFIRSGLKHPAALRLALFEYFSDPDILYFDADWICMNSWQPTCFEGWEKVVACRDFTLDIHYPKQDYAFEHPAFAGTPGFHFSAPETGRPRVDYCKDIIDFTGTAIPYEHWPNTGLLILNRQHHRHWLERALALYCSMVGHHSQYFEQPALIKALDECNVHLDFLPRKYNVLAIKTKKWPSNVIGLHVKLKHHPEFVAALMSETTVAPDRIREYFLE